MKQEIERLCNESPNERYDYFIKNVRSDSAVYVLYNKAKREIALNIDKNNKPYLYLFPNEYSAQFFIDANADMRKYVPHKWELDFFLTSAVDRLKKEKTTNAFVFPNAQGIGFNAPFDKIIKDIQQNIAPPVSAETIKKLLDYLDKNLTDGCKHDYTLTEKFCAENNRHFAGIVDWLRERGGYCDCEILANIEEDDE